VGRIRFAGSRRTYTVCQVWVQGRQTRYFSIFSLATILDDILLAVIGVHFSVGAYSLTCFMLSSECFAACVPRVGYSHRMWTCLRFEATMAPLLKGRVGTVMSLRGDHGIVQDLRTGLWALHTPFVSARSVSRVSIVVPLLLDVHVGDLRGLNWEGSSHSRKVSLLHRW